MSKPFPPLGPEYENFLYAVVCNEKNGMQLTMVSAIARSGADPWTEAARISKLPEQLARRALALLMPDPCTEGEKAADRQIILDRLFSLLPKKKSLATQESKVASNKKSPFARYTKLSTIIIFAFTTTLILTCVFATGSHPGRYRQSAHIDAIAQPEHPII